jgi:outer membrane protein insertion porin family
VHDFTLSTILRQVTSLDQKASPSIIASAGDSIKTSLSHTVVHDKRDDITLPTQGYFVKSMQEFAGLGAGDVRFLKATIDAQYAKTFPQFSPRTHFLWNARGGILWSLEKNATTRITDRFHLGGPTDVRGFRHFGIGPKDGSISKTFIVVDV